MRFFQNFLNRANKGHAVLFLLRALPLLCLPSAHAQQYAFQYFGAEQGLTNLGVKTLYQDRTGFIWLGTENGVFRYEGVRFRQYGAEKGLTPNVSASMGEGPDGAMLVGNQSGLFRLRGDRFEAVPMPGAKRVFGYAGIARIGDTTWIATDAGLLGAVVGPDGKLLLQPGPPSPDSTRPDARSILVDQGSIWWGCGGSLCKSTPTAARQWQTEDVGARTGLKKLGVSAMIRDREGNLWVQQNRRLVGLMAGGAKFEEPVPPLPPVGTGTFGLDSDGKLLVPTTDGLAIRENGQFRMIGRTSGLLPPVYSVLQDNEGSVWLGLAGRGLAKWMGYNEWESYTAQSGLTGETVYEIAPRENGEAWVGTESGLFHGNRNGNEWTWQLQKAVERIPIHAVRPQRDGKLWLGTDGKAVALFNPKGGGLTWYGPQQGLDGKLAYALLVDSADGVWVGTESGIFILEKGAKAFQRVSAVPKTRTWALEEAPNGDIWAGTSDGLWWRSGQTWRRFTEKDGLRSNSVLSIAADKTGGVWIGYRLTGTITRLEWGPTGTPVIKHMPTLPGPVSNITYFLNFDHQGRLWAGSNFGVQVLSADGTRWDRYDHRDGLVWDDCDLHGFAADPDGHIWIGTSGGLSRFMAKPKTATPEPPRAILTSATLGKTELDPAKRAVLDYTSDTLVIRFTALRFGHDRDLEFRYQLKPLVNTWRETSERELQFPALPANTYRLEVEARDAGGEWSQTPASLDFTVNAPWWRTWWFMGGSLVSVLVLGAVMLQRRTKREFALRHALETAVAERTRELSHQYRHDVLTGLPNRLLFGERLNRELISAGMSGTNVAVLFIDLDRFKRINDTWGHRVGDVFLKQVAERLRSGLLQDEMIARIGGDEFIVLIPGLRDKREAEVRGWDVMRSLEAPIVIEDKNIFATMSVGIAVFPADAPDASTLMAAADAAMYRAKDSGKNQVQPFVKGMMEAASRPQNIEDRLRAALESGGFRLRYQPQYSVDGALTGFEALLRLVGAEKELSPGEFVPIAEETGLIVDIGRWVLREACRQAKEWHDAGFPHIRIAVNVSVVQLVSPDFEATLSEALRETGMDPGRLELELTETALLRDAGASAGLLGRIRKKGIHIALDDFGTGFSSMQFLHQLPVDAVKIDRLFVRDLEGKTPSIPLVEGMVKLARTLRLRVVAEGVETEDQLAILRGIGFDAAQGHLMSLPVTADEAYELLLSGPLDWI